MLPCAKDCLDVSGLESVFGQWLFRLKSYKTYSAEKLNRCRIRVTAADTGVAEGVERIVPLGSEMDIAAKVVSLLFCSLREVVWRIMKGGVGWEL